VRFPFGAIGALRRRRRPAGGGVRGICATSTSAIT